MVLTFLDKLTDSPMTSPARSTSFTLQPRASRPPQIRRISDKNRNAEAALLRAVAIGLIFPQ